jgi:hypothetical protein
MNDNSLFTFLVEYKRGTYIKQVSASNVNSALNVWRAKALEEIAKLSQTPLSNFVDLNLDLVRVDGCVNVWCLTSSVGNKLFLMNIVATAE